MSKNPYDLTSNLFSTASQQSLSNATSVAFNSNVDLTSDSRSGGAFGISNQGIFSAAKAGAGLLSDVAGVFQKNAKADATNAMNQMKHQQSLAIWKHNNDETLRSNVYAWNSWADRNVERYNIYNNQVAQYNFGAQMYERNVDNIMDASKLAWNRSFTNFQRKQQQAGLQDEEQMREYLASLGAKNEQTGASAARRRWGQDLTQALNNRDSLLMDRDLGRDIQMEADDINIRLTASLNQAWANLGLPPVKPGMLSEPFTRSYSPMAPIRPATVQGSDWTDWAKAGANVATTMLGMPGGIGNFFL